MYKKMCLIKYMPCSNNSNLFYHSRSKNPLQKNLSYSYPKPYFFTIFNNPSMKVAYHKNGIKLLFFHKNDLSYSFITICQLLDHMSQRRIRSSKRSKRVHSAKASIHLQLPKSKLLGPTPLLSP